MDLSKYTDKTRELIQSAQALALTKGHQRFTPLHVLISLLGEATGTIKRLLAINKIDLIRLKNAAENALKTIPQVEGNGAGQLHMAPETAKLFDISLKIAQKKT